MAVPQPTHSTWRTSWMPPSLGSYEKLMQTSVCRLFSSVEWIALSMIGLTEWIKKYSFCFCLLKETVENWYNFFFFNSLVEITRKPVWTWFFLFQKVIHKWLSFFNRSSPIQIVLRALWQIVSVKELVPFIQVIKPVALELFLRDFYYPFVACEICSDSPLSFLVLVILVFFP